MILTLTPDGYGLVQQALIVGGDVEITEFKIGTRAQYTVLSTRAWPRGTLLYSSRITDSFALSLDQMCWICDIDSWEPEFITGEIVLFAGPTKFAQGNFGTGVPRRRGEALRVFPQVYCRGIARVCTQQYSADSPLDRFATVDQLLQADFVRRTAVCVLRGKRASDSSTVKSPMMVVKSSGQDTTAKWIPVNCNLAYRGPVEQPASNQIKLPSSVAVNLFKRDVVMVQVLSGPDTYACRSVTNITVRSVITLSMATVVPECEIWISPAVFSDGDCLDAPKFDEETDDSLPDPEPLCEGDQIIIIDPPPPPPPPPWIPDPPIPPWVILPPPPPPPPPPDEPPPPPPDWPIPPPPPPPPPDEPKPPPPPPITSKRVAVHFSSRPLAYPFEVGEVDVNVAYAGVQRRLRQIAPEPAAIEFTINRWFSPEFASQFDRRIQWAYALVPDSEEYNTNPIVSHSYSLVSHGWLSGFSFPSGFTTYSGRSSELTIAGDYPNLLATLPKSTTPSVINVYNGLNAILIPEFVRLVVFEFPNFQGRILADLFGPMYLMSRQGYNNVRYDSAHHVPVYYRSLETTVPIALPSDLGLPPQTLPPVSVSSGPYYEPGSVGEPPSINYRTDPNVRQFDWSLHDVAWRGTVGQTYPRQVRFVSDQRLYRLVGNTLREQPTPYLLEPDLWKWKGSFKVIEVRN
jgi:hypothetical protein